MSVCYVYDVWSIMHRPSWTLNLKWKVSLCMNSCMILGVWWLVYCSSFFILCFLLFCNETASNPASSSIIIISSLLLNVNINATSMIHNHIYNIHMDSHFHMASDGLCTSHCNGNNNKRWWYNKHNANNMN